ncbi:PH domain-containing protein [Rufibacter sediminis]|uniref:PH domain-containing protein n=1 Tax=Rufibacter sediminis TaxID=2762756 RepID=A0ABR6VQQ9_9BACT|nr:PH domain-containing protein [Rufibacter sediminis]MBC3539538.1 PH domain-containing protein [Rufibacter sediminis]
MVSPTFPSSKSWVSTLAIWGTTVLLTVVLVQELQSSMPLAGKIALGLFCLLISGLLLWMWFATYYRISGETLHFRCGPLHGNIPIRQIKGVQQNHYLWSGFRPALGLQGMVIHFNRWDQIYLSPAEKESFLRALQEVNPEIEVKE